jgi:hypothetical protein
VPTINLTDDELAAVTAAIRGVVDAQHAARSSRARAGNGRHRARGMSLPVSLRNALRRFARTRAWRRAVSMRPAGGPRLLFSANFLLFPAF